MAKVIIDGIEYVPKAEIPELTDIRLRECLEVLTEMRHFNQSHKMMSLAWNALNALSPELAKLDADVAYHRVHGFNDNTPSALINGDSHKLQKELRYLVARVE